MSNYTFNKSIQTEQQKLILKYLIQNKDLIPSTSDKIFQFEATPPAKIFKIIKKYYLENKSLASEDIIILELKNNDEYKVNEKIVHMLISTENFFVDDFIKETYEFYNKYALSNDRVLNQIDMLHNCNSINSVNKLIEDLHIENNEFNIDENDIDELENTDIISEDVYNNLPEILKKMCDVFDTNRKKDIFLISELTALSILFPNVYGIYHNDPTFPNLYSFIAAPAASNKSVMNYARDTLYQISKKLKSDFQIEKNRYTEDELKLNNIKEKRIIIQGNSSAASFINELSNNNGIGLIFENEADTITQNKKQDWGDYSDSLRKAFANENITSSRKGEGLIEIENPKLSVCISGTIEQLFKFIPSAENGLFSRFIYYTFKDNTVFKNPFKNKINYKELFEENFGNEILNMYNFFNNKKIIFELTEKQADMFYDKYDKILKKTQYFNIEKDIEATIIRMGSITFRICMILSILRKYEKLGNNKLFEDVDEIICEDIDFDIAFTFTINLINHSKLIYNNMPQNKTIQFQKNNWDSLFYELPNNFSKSDIVNLSKKFDKVCDKTIQRHINQWIKTGLVSKDGRFIYIKNKKS